MEETQNNNADLIRGTKKTSFVLGLMSGVAGTSMLALIGLFIVMFAGQNLAGSKNTNTDSGNANANTNQVVVETEPTVAAEVPAITGDDHVKGGDNAKVTLVEYSDFQCPYCSRHNSTMDEIYKAYGNKVKIVFRHFPLSFHPEAQKAAEASECAAEQGKFWEMHDKIFAANEAGTMSVEKWKTEAKNLKLNTGKFNDCLDSGKYADRVSQMMAAGSAAGVEGTPATFVNGELVSGALPLAQFKTMIDAQL